MSKASLSRLTRTTASEESILAALEKDGAVIIENIASPPTLAGVSEQLAPHFDQTPPGEGLFFGRRTVRFGGVIAKSRASYDLCLNPLVFGAIEKVLLSYCTSVQLNLSQAISIGSGEPEQILHADDEMWMTPRNGTEYLINAMWALTDFTKENGATRIVPGSHKGPIRRMVDEDELAYAEMSAGSVVLWRGSALHGGGANTTSTNRAGIVMSYSLGWLRQAENQYLVAPPEFARTMPARLRDLIGYQVHEPNLGHYEGQDPRLVFEDGALSKPLPFRDHLPQSAKDELNAYYSQIAAE